MTYCSLENENGDSFSFKCDIVTKGFRSDDFLVVGCIRGRSVEGTVDFEVVVYKTPLVDDDICREKGGLDILGVPIFSSVKGSYTIPSITHQR